MAQPDDTPPDLPLDEAFDRAFDHLAVCRTAYDDDPRDPERIAALGAARVSLEDARTAMNAERVRLGLEPRQVRIPEGPRVDSDGQPIWKGIHPE